ncbi:ANTAR domain-containing protein [Cellulomonas cellasea]|uniref:ANTAR domain-containing protein n=2 Tax=Cellulomonas cellasea TaxID=43670 RepID=A0A0A0B162_9CELL|nr:ANTAR domain-containing protein [Cellulomonas cellasea]KGM00545.1 hypothetical protein Q760_08060 [Cellulomonas cellasea DSM 20118]GEA86806.1 transcriptional regulator [Cellulomonas cellasea]
MQDVVAHLHERVSPYLRERVGAVARDLGGSAGITIQQQGALVRAASSDERAARCGQVEARLGTGPSIAAMEQLHPVVVPRVPEGDGWAAWRACATEVGFASSAAVPAPVARGISVALTLYSAVPGAWDPLALAEAHRHARLLAAEIAARLARPGEPPRGALEACLRLDRAIGVLMHCNGCTAQDAQTALLRASTADHVDLDQAASTVLRALTEDDSSFRPRALVAPGR